ERARRETVNAIVLACRDMPADRLLQTVSTRAPGGFERIDDVLSTAELAAFDQAYRSTTLPDVAALNTRPSLTVTSGGSSRTSGGGWPRCPRPARRPTAPRRGRDPTA